MNRRVWLFPFISSALGLGIGVLIFGNSYTIMQEILAVSVTVGFSVIPYVMARSLEKYHAGEDKSKLNM